MNLILIQLNLALSFYHIGPHPYKFALDSDGNGLLKIWSLDTTLPHKIYTYIPIEMENL